MAKRDNHYEAAFEEFLRFQTIAYVAVDEAKRSKLADSSLKSLDFIVSSRQSCNLLVDVKGRLFPSGKTYWKNWTTYEDLDALRQWEQLFGPEFAGLIVFAFDVVGDKAPLPYDQLFAYHGRLYGFVAVRRDDYQRHAKPISPRWQTLAIPVQQFRHVAQPLADFL